MSLIIYNLVNEYLPVRRRQTPKGWIIFNSVCCHHRGHNQDSRSRGNFLANGDGVMVANCYNCGFKAIYGGADISSNFMLWMGYLGIPREKIQEAKFEIMKKKLDGELTEIHMPQWMRTEEFKEVELPEGSIPFRNLLSEGNNSTDFIHCVNYLKSRGRTIEHGWDYHWSPLKKWDLNKRIIIPFRDKGKIIGWTARHTGKTGPDTPRYFNSDIPIGYLFNGDVISQFNRKYVIIVEGPFDAISIDCVGALGSKLNAAQISWLNSTDKEKIILPDIQQKNQGLIDIALEEGWSVSFPEWEEKIKDAADAQCRYGQLYTLASVLSAKTAKRMQIEFKRKLLKGRDV